MGVKANDGCKLVAFKISTATSGPFAKIECSVITTMAEQQMRYRFARAFIVEGLLATEGQEIVLSDQPDKGRKFMLTGSPDSLLADADKSAAAGLIAISRITVAGAPPPPPPRPVSDIVDEIRSSEQVCDSEQGREGRSRGPPLLWKSMSLFLRRGKKWERFTEPCATASRNTCRLAAWEASCRNRNGANERDSSTKEATKSLGMLAQTFGKPPDK
jgi:hypothetical protein